MRFKLSLTGWFLLLGCANGTAPSTATSSAATSATGPTPSLVAPANGSTQGPGTQSSSAEANPDDGPFRLLFRDEFDALESSRWQLVTHSWGGNLAVFSSDSPVIEDGKLLLRLLAAPDGTRVDGEDKPFLGAEVRSKDTLTYGRVRARIRFPRASAVVSSLVTIYTPWPADNWNELDIESLGQDPTEVQFNTMVYTGPVMEQPVSESVSPTQDPLLEDLGFDSSLDYHEYTIEWTPERATFWVDGNQRHTWSEHIDLMTLPQNVLLTIWASDSEGWVGPVTAETVGATVVYDWVELWEYTGPIPPSSPRSEGAASSSETSVSPATTAATMVGSTTALSSTEVGADAGNRDSDSQSDSTTPTDQFALVFRDDFDTLDSERWQLMTHSWDSNLALFSAESVTVADGMMALTLLDAPAGTTDDTGAAKQFLGAEVRSTATVNYGRVRARARFSDRSGVVSALVAIYTPWPADNWNELDIEHLGATPDQVQFNTMVYLGDAVGPVTTSVTPTQFPERVDLGFDASAAFHEYQVEWTPDYVEFAVDGSPKHRWTEHLERLGLPQNVLLTIWASSSADWAGQIDGSTTGAKVEYDWVEVYEYRDAP